MDAVLYTEFEQFEDNHWWFVGRRQIINKIISGLDLPEHAEIFEAGCGTGGNLPMLAQHGSVYAMEPFDSGRAAAIRRNCAEVAQGALPDNIPFPGKQFDLIVLLDVIEHLEHDVAALDNLRARLKPNGYLVVTVPAHPFLWSRHDELNHHYRRYLRSGLVDVVQRAGYRPSMVSYFNSLLFPAVAAVRLTQRLLGKEAGGSDVSMPAAGINALLTRLFAAERHVLERVSLPFGVSLVLVAQKTAQ